MNVIVNADDFGFDLDRDLGILYGVLKGYISSVSVVVTNKIGIFRKIIIKIIKRRASVGIHINLTDNPLVKYNMKEFCNNDYKYEKSKFIFWRNAIEEKIKLQKIKEEILEQINIFEKKYHFIPEHIDGHNHCNIFNRNIEKIFEEISIQKNIHLRIPYENLNNFNKSLINNNEFFKDYYKFNNLKVNKKIIIDNINYFFKYDMYINNYMCKINCKEDNIKYIGTMYGYFREPLILFKQLLYFNEKDTVQIMVHPGFYFNWIVHKTQFSNKDRYIELKSLKNLKKLLKKQNISYINYKMIGGKNE